MCVCVHTERVKKERNRTLNQERLAREDFVKSSINRSVWPDMRRESGIICLLVAEDLEILAMMEIYTCT